MIFIYSYKDINIKKYLFFFRYYYIDKCIKGINTYNIYNT